MNSNKQNSQRPKRLLLIDGGSIRLKNKLAIAFNTIVGNRLQDTLIESYFFQ